MRIDAPRPEDIPHLRQLWQEAFGDSNEFLDTFFSTGFSPERCRCMTEEGTMVAALYWFDCALAGQKLAYLYAVATAAKFRGRGLCRMLMEDTHNLLRSRGYAGAVLVPGEDNLFWMYEKLGYRSCSGVEEFSCFPSRKAVPVRQVSVHEYTTLRRQLLPERGVIQEGENLSFLHTQANLYAGEGFLLAAVTERSSLKVVEYLGEKTLAPRIVKALGKKRGRFRMPGNSRPFAMFHPLTPDAPRPKYFGLAFD